jgi:hypothetical protein
MNVPGRVPGTAVLRVDESRVGAGRGESERRREADALTHRPGRGVGEHESARHRGRRVEGGRGGHRVRRARSTRAGERGVHHPVAGARQICLGARTLQLRNLPRV